MVPFRLAPDSLPHRLLQAGEGAVALNPPHELLQLPHARLHVPAVALEPGVEEVQPGAVEHHTDEPRIVHRPLGQTTDLEAPKLGAHRTLEPGASPGPGLRPPGLQCGGI